MIEWKSIEEMPVADALAIENGNSYMSSAWSTVIQDGDMASAISGCVTSMLEYALRLRAHGLPVVPLWPRSKRPWNPRHLNGKEWETLQAFPLNADELRSAWARVPRANVGVLLAGTTGVQVLDLDPRNFDRGSRTPNEIKALVTDPDKLAVPFNRTGGGGVHFFFKRAENLVGQLADTTAVHPGVEWYAGNAHNFVFPPSIHPNTRRAYVEGIELLPARLTETLADRLPWLATSIYNALGLRRDRGDHSGNGAAKSEVVERLTAALIAHWPAHSGDRHGRALAFGGWAARNGIPEAHALAAMERTALMAKDDEPEDRKHAVTDSYAKHALGVEVKGASALTVEMLHSLEAAVQHSKGFGNIGTASRQPGKWEHPIPFDMLDLPEFPIDILPDWQGNWVRETAEALQVPPDLPALLLLAVTGCAAAKKCEVQARLGWKEPLNLMVAIALPPGERKSAVFGEAVAPIIEFEREHSQEWRSEFEKAKAEYEVMEQRLEAAKRVAAKGEGGKDCFSELAEELSKLRRPVYPRLFADDITPEKLGSMLADQGGRLGIFSAEGGLFGILAGRYADGAPVFDVVLKGHSGDALRVDRVSRPADVIDSPALTIGLTVQPGVLRDLAERKVFVERGLMARFLFALPRPRVGTRRPGRTPVSKTVADLYDFHVKALLEIPLDVNLQGESIPKVLRLTETADMQLLAFEEKLEPRLGPEGDMFALGGLGGKLAGALLRIAGLFHLANHVGSGSRIIPAQVEAETMERALRLAPYLIAHAKAVFRLIGGGHYEEAERILKWIMRQDASTFSKREAWRALQGHLRRTADLDGPLQLLQDHGYIRPAPGETEPKPGRPSEVYEVNPIARIAKTPRAKNDHGSLERTTMEG